MQPLSRVSTKGTLYSDVEVVAMMVSPTVVETWLVDLLDRNGNYKSDLTPFVDAASPRTNSASSKGNPAATISGSRGSSQVMTISHDTTKAVHRAITLRMLGNVIIDPLQDMLRVHYRLLAPDGGWLEWTIGTFLMLIPDREINAGFTFLQVKGADLTQLLVDAAVATTWSVSAGQSYLNAITNVIDSYGGSYHFNIQIPDPYVQVPATLSWDAGTSRLKIVNDLLEAINYHDLWCDENGTLRSDPIPLYAQVTPSYTFDTAGASLLGYPVLQQINLNEAYNQFLVVGSDPRVALFRGQPLFHYKTFFNYLYENTDPSSPISTVNWHPKLKKIDDHSIPNDAVAAQRAKIEAQKSAFVYSTVTFNTFPWPVSQNLDIYGFAIDTPDEGLRTGKYLEIGWSMACATGASTAHQVALVTGS